MDQSCIKSNPDYQQRKLGVLHTHLLKYTHTHTQIHVRHAPVQGCTEKS